jgi:hypothetical protein
VIQTGLQGDDMMNENIDEIIKRTQRKWWIDGLSEMGTGLLMLIFSGFFLAIAQFQAGPLKAMLATFGQLVVILGGAKLINLLVKWLKERITYPRIGYFSFKPNQGKARAKRITRSLGIGVIVSASVILYSYFVGSSGVWTIVGLLIAVILSISGMRMGLIRFTVSGFLVLVAGLLTTYLQLPDDYQSVVFFAQFGLIWLGTGGITLWKFLRKTRPSEES